MKKLILALMLGLSAFVTQAIPAHPGNATAKQPDGTTLTITLRGDEFYNFTTTADGYTLLRNAEGGYEYARLDGEKLVSTGVLAHNLGQRTAAEQSLTAGLTKNLVDLGAVTQSKSRRASRDANSFKIQRYDYNKFRGLIILIDFSDAKFSMADPNSFYDHMVNDENFTGYTEDNGGFVNCTGSVRDYFDDQSNGLFKPHFDVVGPISLSSKSTTVNNNAQTVFRNALAAANSQVDYSDYDTDNNGVVDMVFFVCAGMSSSFAGNTSGLLWPHRSRLYGVSYDGKSFGDYACTTELYGWENQPSTITIEGIGTFCHEFSHVLGFPDFYDTDYAQSGGESNHPGGWDLMAGGASYNYGRTPCGYTIFERYSLGWAAPEVITTEDDFVLDPVNEGNSGYILKTPVQNEFFIFENRQKTGWDSYLPGHGMIIARVDSTNLMAWVQNNVNDNPAHNYYELVRAGNAIGDSPTDPFPGSAKVTFISNETSPNLLTWAGKANDYLLHSITETGRQITFSTRRVDNIETIVEDFETMPVTTSTRETGVQGRFASWNFSKANVMSPDEEDAKNGNNAVGIVSGGVMTMASSLEQKAYMVKLHAYNSSTTESRFKLSYSEDDGVTWTTLDDIKSVSSKTGKDLMWAVKTTKPVRFRVNMSGGSASKKSYIDDFTIFTDGDIDQGGVRGDVTGDGIVDVSDINAVVNVMLGKAVNAKSDVTGDGYTDVSDINAVINIMLGKN